MNKHLFLILFFISLPFFAQVKIGNNPSIIDQNSLLELESNDKVLVISRMNTNQIINIRPLKGALVYNTDINCIFFYNGSSWINLCNNTPTSSGIKVTTSSSAPVANSLGDFWINSATNDTVSLWDGIKWVPTDNNPRKGNGIPNSTTAPNPLQGDLYVDKNNGNLYSYDGTTWINNSINTSAENGLSINNNIIELGGVLIKPTVLTTDVTNTFAIKGMQNGNIAEDEIVTVNKTTGELRKISSSNLLREEVIKRTASDGQRIFNNLDLKTTNKINVFRNGVRIDFTLINGTTIEIEPEAICYAGDEIKIVQLY